MIRKKIITIILVVTVFVPLFIHSTGYAANMQAAVKEEDSAVLSVTSRDLIRGGWEKSGQKLFFAPASWTDGIKVIPSLAVKEEYNDNIHLSTTDRRSDWISTISPGLAFINKTERLDVGISARLDAIYYTDETELNTVDQFYQGKLNYALTEKLTIGAQAGFTRDSRTDREIDTTGIIIPAEVIRKSQNYGANGGWSINEKTSAGISYNYRKDRYEQESFADQETNNIGLNFTRILNEVTQGHLNLGYSDSHQTGLTRTTVVDSYSGTIGISRNLSNIWSVLINAGAVYSHTNDHFDALGTEQTSNDWGPMGQFTINCNYDEKTNGSLTLSQSVQPVSGTTGVSNRTVLGLYINHKFTDEFSGYLTASYIINKSDQGEFSSTTIDQDTSRVSLGSRYDFNKYMFLMASYSYSRVDYSQNNTYADQHLVMLTFNIQYTFFE